MNLPNFRAPQVVLVVKNLPANAEDLKDDSLISESGRSPGEGMATHSSILAWKIPGLGRSPGEMKGYPLQYSGLEKHQLYCSWDLKESDMTEQLSLSLFTFTEWKKLAPSTSTGHKTMSCIEHCES